MKKFLIIGVVAMLNLTSTALASDFLEEMPYTPSASAVNILPKTNIYLGIEGGYGLTHWEIFTNDDQFKKDSGAVGRIFFGYDFSKYWAIELGYLYFFNTARHEIDSSNYNEMTTQAADIVGKLKVPATDDASFYAKFGLDYFITNIKKTGANSLLMTGKTYYEIDIVYGIGVDYSINSNVVANLEWLRHGGRVKANDGHVQPYTDAFMVGLRYKFDV